MNTNFQPLSEQQCREINGGASTSITLDLLGTPVILAIPDVGAAANGVGTTLVSVSAAVSGLLNSVAGIVGNLLGSLKI